MRHGIVAALIAVLLLGACVDEVPTAADISKLLEDSANQELKTLRATYTPGPGMMSVPERIRIVNLRKLGGVTDSKGVFVTSVEFDLVVVVSGLEMLNQKGAKARMKVRRDGKGWKILEKH